MVVQNYPGKSSRDFDGLYLLKYRVSRTISHISVIFKTIYIIKTNRGGIREWSGSPKVWASRIDIAVESLLDFWRLWDTPHS